MEREGKEKSPINLSRSGLLILPQEKQMDLAKMHSHTPKKHLLNLDEERERERRKKKSFF